MKKKFSSKAWIRKFKATARRLLCAPREGCVTCDKIRQALRGI